MIDETEYIHVKIFDPLPHRGAIHLECLKYAEKTDPLVDFRNNIWYISKIQDTQ